MKKLFLTTIFVTISLINYSQENINGKLVCDTSGFKIIKVWGSHYERGYAYGFLAGDGMIDLYKNYIEPMFGSYMTVAKQYIEEGENIYISEKYQTEAKGLIDGCTAAGFNTEELDYLDLLVCNSFLDFYGFVKSENRDFDSPGCSALMSWGDATINTSLNGKSVISRHVDWTLNNSLKNNQIVVINIPSEEDEQPWIMIGFTGLISALSGVNDNGLASFMHSLSDVNEDAIPGSGYEPIWFANRKALEQLDYNSDGYNNVNDIKDALLSNVCGYSKASIISCVSTSQSNDDELIALVAELACKEPFHSFRTNSYEDLIPGDNLYAANNSIVRNNANSYCSRYNNVVANIGDGIEIDAEINWQILADYSHSSNNMQMMQYIPEDRILKLSVTEGTGLAYTKEPVVMSIDSLFTIPTGRIEENYQPDFKVFPNPSTGNVNIENKFKNENLTEINIYNVSGSKIKTIYADIQEYKTTISLEKGIYIIEMKTEKYVVYKKVVVL
jgi:hypothetical protein